MNTNGTLNNNTVNINISFSFKKAYRIEVHNNKHNKAGQGNGVQVFYDTRLSACSRRQV